MEALSGMALTARVTVGLMGEQRHQLLIKHTAHQLCVSVLDSHDFNTS